MNTKIVKAIIEGIVAVVVAAIGIFAGIKIEERNTQTQINEVIGDVININGDENDITINDIETLIQNYLQLQSDYTSLNQQNNSLVAQNTKYFDDLTEANNKINELNAGYNKEIEDLKTKLASMPIVDYKSLALCIDVEDIPINPNNSMVTIDGRDYFSREIVENLVPENRNLTIKDNTIFIGRVVAEKANLFDKHMNSNSHSSFSNVETDSFGNTHSNVLYFDAYYNHNAIFVLNENYSFFKFTISISDKADSGKQGVIIIKSDDEVIYTSKSLNKQTKPFTEEININNCSLLTIEYTSDQYCQCIISDAVVYN